ncbi:hypothetical protein [Limnohabitans sp.]|uniref:hypothetical protein n=1 Tax=Limnohabitans sp. TaxID=1907725 RepID=UPI0038621BA5
MPATSFEICKCRLGMLITRLTVVLMLFVLLVFTYLGVVEVVKRVFYRHALTHQ